MNFGEWIVLKLKQMGKSQAWLIRRVELSEGSIQRWCNGEEPNLDTVLLICGSLARFLGVRPKQIVYQAIKENPALWRGRE